MAKAGKRAKIRIDGVLMRGLVSIALGRNVSMLDATSCGDDWPIAVRGLKNGNIGITCHSGSDVEAALIDLWQSGEEKVVKLWASDVEDIGLFTVNVLSVSVVVDVRVVGRTVANARVNQQLSDEGFTYGQLGGFTYALLRGLTYKELGGE